MKNNPSKLMKPDFIRVKSKPSVLTSVNMLSDHERERLIQEQYGRERLTLATNKPSEGEKMTEVNEKPKAIDGKNRFVSREESDRRAARRANGKPVEKSQKVGHEACLAKAVYERRRIEIHTTCGASVSGELLEFDKYSIRLRDEQGECMWYFKSALMGFKEIY